jgi:hypothetical protein
MPSAQLINEPFFNNSSKKNENKKTKSFHGYAFHFNDFQS